MSRAEVDYVRLERMMRACVAASKRTEPEVAPSAVPRHYRISTVAKMLDISRQSVHAAVVRGDLPAVKIFAEHTPPSSTPDDPRVARGSWRITEPALLAYLAKCEAKR
jgi:hypothetical protein